MMKYRRGPAIFGCTTLAMAATLAMATPNIGWAGQLTVTEQLPNTRFTQTDILGSSANGALTPGSSYSGPLPTITTTDGRFEFIFSNVSAADPNGFPTISGSMTLVNLLGGQGSLFLDFKQAFVPNPIFNFGCYDGVGLSGTFTETAVHGNNVFGVGLVGGVALPGVAASDTNGGAFNVVSAYYFLPPPTEFEGQVTFNFTASSQAGDAITIPFTILPPSLSATGVPEPSSWILAATAAMAGLRYWTRWPRREAN
jgi:hypothetical protein